MIENLGKEQLSNHTAGGPLMSVIVTIGERRRRGLRCIDAIQAQRGAPPMQIIVVDVFPSGGHLGRSGIDYLPLPGCESINAAKAAGAGRATAPVMAFLEDHCVPEPGWAAAVHRAFTQNPEVAAVAYSFGNLNPVNWVSRSFLVLAYGPWMGPAPSGPVSTPSWMNVAYHRKTLATVPDLAAWFGCEGLFLHRIKVAGAKFWHAGDAEVRHLNHPGLLGSARDSACWQRLFAATRVEIDGWGWFRRIAYALGTIPFGPSLITFRLARRLWARPEMRSQLVKALPLVFFVYTWGSFSEVLGYIAGAGDAPSRTIYVETGDPRGEAL